MHSALYNVRTHYAALYCLIIEKMKNIANIFVVDLAISPVSLSGSSYDLAATS